MRAGVGSENDVLDRYYQTARLLKPEYVIRLTADCPCFDAELLDTAIREMAEDTDYMGMTSESFADGLEDCVLSMEEFAAGTDPSDKKSHPDYFDSLKLVMPLKETYLPFYLRSYMKTPAGMRLEFFDPKRRNDYGKSGYRYSVLVGEPVGDTGFVAKGFEQKERKQKIAGSNVERSVDVSEATIARQSDGKTLIVSLVEKRTPVETQATIAFSRGEPSEFTATAGKTFKLYESTYKVIDIKSVGKGAKVTIEDPLGKIRTLEAVDR